MENWGIGELRLETVEQCGRKIVCKVKSLYEGVVNMKRPILIILSVAVVFLLVGSLFINLLSSRIGQTFSYVSNELPGYGGGAAPVEQPALFDSAAPLPSSEVGKTAVDIQTQERLVIQNADLAIVVKDPKARMDEIADLAKEMGGFVVSSKNYMVIGLRVRQEKQSFLSSMVPEVMERPHF